MSYFYKGNKIRHLSLMAIMSMTYFLWINKGWLFLFVFEKVLDIFEKQP